MGMLVYLSNLGMGGGGTVKRGGREYSVKKRRVLIGDKQFILSEDQLRDLLVQMAAEASVEEAPAKAPERAPVVAKQYPEFKRVPQFVPIAQQQVRNNDLQTLALMREIAREIEFLRDEEDVAILLLH